VGAAVMVWAFVTKMRSKKNRQAFLLWRFLGFAGLRLAVPLRQKAREVEEKAEEPACHTDIQA